MLRDYRIVNKKSWSPGVIEKKVGRSTYLCRTSENDKLCKRHNNQIIKRQIEGSCRHKGLDNNAENQPTTVKIAYFPPCEPTTHVNDELTRVSGKSRDINQDKSSAEDTSSGNSVSAGNELVKEDETCKLTVHRNQIINKNINTNNFYRETPYHEGTNTAETRKMTKGKAEERIQSEEGRRRGTGTIEEPSATNTATDSTRKSTRIRKHPEKLQDYVLDSDDL